MIYLFNPKKKAINLANFKTQSSYVGCTMILYASLCIKPNIATITAVANKELDHLVTGTGCISGKMVGLFLTSIVFYTDLRTF